MVHVGFEFWIAVLHTLVVSQWIWLCDVILCTLFNSILNQVALRNSQSTPRRCLVLIILHEVGKVTLT